MASKKKTGYYSNKDTLPLKGKPLRPIWNHGVPLKKGKGVPLKKELAFLQKKSVVKKKYRSLKCVIRLMKNWLPP